MGDLDSRGFDGTTFMTINALGSSTAILNIDCAGQNDCSYATIWSGDDTEIDVVCDGQNSCNNLEIDARNSASFQYECSGSGSCSGIDIRTDSPTSEPTEPTTYHYVVKGDRTSQWFAAGSPDYYCNQDTVTDALYDTDLRWDQLVPKSIAVSCCSIDGSTGYRPDCDAEPATYDEAYDLCSSFGYRLCTLNEMLNLITMSKGCKYDHAYNWVSDACEAYSPHRYIAAGNYPNGAWTTTASLCTDVTSNQATESAPTYGTNIAVGCCELDGSGGARPDCNAHPQTYDDAEAICYRNGYRLCTLNELLDRRLTNGKGCGYDNAYNWVSDACEECSCTFTGWQHGKYAGDAYTTSIVGVWYNVPAANKISSLAVHGSCELEVANGNDGASILYTYGEGTYTHPLPSGNDNINSVKLECVTDDSMAPMMVDHREYPQPQRHNAFRNIPLPHGVEDVASTWNDWIATKYTTELTMKDMVLIGLVILNLSLILVVIVKCCCNRCCSNQVVAVKYEPVSIVTESENE